jgi:hypothetical protein
MVKVARQKAALAGGEGKIREWVTDPNVLAGKQWPVVTLIGVLDYYPDPVPLLGTVCSYLTSGGRLVFTLPHALSPLAWLYVLTSRFTVPATARTPAFARKAVERTGLSVVATRYAYPALPIVGHTLIIIAEN